MDYNDYLGGRPARDWDDPYRPLPLRQSSTLGGLSGRGPSSEHQSMEALQTRCAILETDLRRYMGLLSESRGDVAAQGADRARLANIELENDKLRRSCQEKEARYQELVTRLEAAEERRDRLEIENDGLQRSCQEKEGKYQDLVTRHEVSDERRERLHASAIAAMAHLHKQELEVSKRRHTELEKKVSVLETEVSVLITDKEAWEDLHSMEVKKRKSLQKDINILRELQQIESPRIRSLTSQLKEREAEVAQLNSTVLSLEEMQSNLEPLAEIGAAIRTRFMNQARQMVTGEPSNRETIKRGNAAAHRADGRVDAALLNGEFMSKAEYTRMSNVFMDLYKQSPSEYGSWPQKILDAIDCEATIRTTLSIKRQLGSMPQRLQASEQMNELWRKFEKLGFDEFEENRDVQWRLDRLKHLTGEIVEAARLTR